jgi:hypothetical protein
MLLQDLRYAVRTLLANPGFAITAILCLSLGIGLNSAIFSVVDRDTAATFSLSGAGPPGRPQLDQPARRSQSIRAVVAGLSGSAEGEYHAFVLGCVHWEDADHFGWHW